MCLDVAFPTLISESSSDIEGTGEGSLPLVLSFEERSRRYEDYKKVRSKASYGNDLRNVILESEKDNLIDPRVLQKRCKFYYELELLHNLHACKNSTPIGYEKVAAKATDDFFFECLGTDSTTDMFYSNVDNGFFVRTKKLLCRRSPKVWKFVNSTQFMRAFFTLIMVAAIFCYYLDWIKDTLLIFEISKFIGGEKVGVQVRLLFSTCVLSVILPLLINIMSVLRFNRWSNQQKLMASIFIIFVPTVIKYRVYRLRLQYQSELQAGRGQRFPILLKLKCQINELGDLSIELRSNENITEHLIQVIVNLLLILISKSNTTTASFIAEHVLGQVSIFFLVTSTAWSFLSLIRGQLSLLISKKGHYVPFLGKYVVLIAYYTTTTLARVWAVVLLVTPYLGLFDTLHHYNHGSKQAWPQKADHVVFDIGPNGTAIWFNKLWNDEYKFDSLEQFYDFSPNLLIIPLIIVLIIHPILSHLIHSEIYYKGIEPGNKKWITKVHHSLHTIISPPLDKDWELIYRLIKLNGIETSVQKCWRRSKLLLLSLQGLMLFEHVVMLVPLLALRSAIQKRNTDLVSNFSLLEDEKYSTDIVNYLLLSGFVGFPLLSATSLLLAYVYFVKWHAWTRKLCS